MVKTGSARLPVRPDKLTARGQGTRDALLRAAREVFEREGFLAARVEQISQAADVSYGSFYRYFESREEIFRELSNQLFDDIHVRPADQSARTPAERLIAANRAYYDAYQRNARLLAIVEQVATFDEEFRQLRHRHRMKLVERTAGAIRRWQHQGQVHADLDPMAAARALGAMVDHTLYLTLVLGETVDRDVLLDTLDRMCLGALGLR